MLGEHMPATLQIWSHAAWPGSESGPAKPQRTHEFGRHVACRPSAAFLSMDSEHANIDTLARVP